MGVNGKTWFFDSSAAKKLRPHITHTSYAHTHFDDSAVNRNIADGTVNMAPEIVKSASAGAGGHDHSMEDAVSGEQRVY